MPEIIFFFITIIEGHWKTLNAENDTASNTVINLSASTTYTQFFKKKCRWGRPTMLHKVLHQIGCRNLDSIQFRYDGSDLFATLHAASNT